MSPYVNPVNSHDQAVENKKVNVALTPLPAPYITGMKLQADIALGDLILNTIDANNVIWVCTDVKGWWTPPDPDIPQLSRGLGDGDYDVRGRWQARQIELSGSILPPSPSYSSVARDTLIRACSLVYTGAWLKTNENPPRASYVRLSGKPNIETVNARGRIDFSIGLRAPDPVKYKWNESDPDGYESVTIPSKSTSPVHTGAGTVNNVGNTPVTAIFDITGPLTGPATIQNTTTDELILVIDSLRAGVNATVISKALTSNVATITTLTSHGLSIDDEVTIAGVDSTFNGIYIVTGTPASNTFTYDKVASNVASTGSGGTVVRDPDHLEIDTYDHSVAFNGLTYGARSKIDTLVDWIKLNPGNNSISFVDEGNANSTASLTVYYRSGWIG